MRLFCKNGDLVRDGDDEADLETPNMGVSVGEDETREEERVEEGEDTDVWC